MMDQKLFSEALGLYPVDSPQYKVGLLCYNNSFLLRKEASSLWPRTELYILFLGHFWFYGYGDSEAEFKYCIRLTVYWDVLDLVLPD